MQSYLNFLRDYQHMFENAEARKFGKVFTKLASAIGTRESQHVKSKHQKMMRRYKSVDSIIKAITYYMAKHKEGEDAPFFDDIEIEDDHGCLMVSLTLSTMTDTREYTKEGKGQSTGKNGAGQESGESWNPWVDSFLN